MDNKIFEKINQLIEKNKIELAESELKNLGQEYTKNSKFLFLRGKIFFLKKQYYISIDTLLIALEFENLDEIYKLLSSIYKILGNDELSNKLSNPDLRLTAVNLLKDSMTGIYRKNNK